MQTKNAGQAGWRLKNRSVELFITKNGGHMAPVSFYADTRNPVMPYYISPWQGGKNRKFPDPILAPLRGDFFCMPFGGNAEVVNGEKHSCHGETASGKWKFIGQSKKDGVIETAFEMRTKIRTGKVVKNICLVDGQNAIYTSHLLEGYSGRMPVGHHAILSVPEGDDAIGISTSKYEFGMTNPGIFSNPASGEYQAFDIGRKFHDLRSVPMQRNVEYDNCSLFPRRKGFDDLLQIFKSPGATPAWTVAVFRDQGYLWFSLKDAGVLPGTVLWMSNCGRHSFPWNGQNRCLAVEDTCSYFANGLKDSISDNFIEKAGFRTALELSRNIPTVINYIQGVARIPAGFGMRVVKTIFEDDSVTFISLNGKRVKALVRHEFLKQGIFKK